VLVIERTRGCIVDTIRIVVVRETEWGGSFLDLLLIISEELRVRMRLRSGRIVQWK
jgi:hypothetical protein